MASPHTAGVVALYLETAATTPLDKTTPTEVRKALFGRLSTGVLSAGKGSPNALLFSNLLTVATSGRLVLGMGRPWRVLGNGDAGWSTARRKDG